MAKIDFSFLVKKSTLIIYFVDVGNALKLQRRLRIATMMTYCDWCCCRSNDILIKRLASIYPCNQQTPVPLSQKVSGIPRRDFWDQLLLGPHIMLQIVFKCIPIIFIFSNQDIFFISWMHRNWKLNKKNLLSAKISPISAISRRKSVKNTS